MFLLMQAGDQLIRNPTHNARLHRKPEFLSDTEAAALPLAGLTAYRAAVVKAQIKPGQKVLIPGIGSGVATLAAQFAVASGAEVWVTSKQNEKIEKAIQVLKVSGGANYNDKVRKFPF